MTKADLTEFFSQKTQLHIRKAEEIVNFIFDQMSETLAKDDRIEIRGFGSFVNRAYGAYQGRNPKSGELVQVPAKRVPFFKVGKELKLMVENAP